jgi:hypothetical protein
MPWEIDRDRSVLHVRITAPVSDWPALFEGVRTNLTQPLPYVVYMPSYIEGGSAEDAQQLRVLRDTVGKFGVLVLSPESEVEAPER